MRCCRSRSQASEWEEPVALSWSGQGPDHLHVSGYAEPANPPIHVDTTYTIDDYGNVDRYGRAHGQGPQDRRADADRQRHGQLAPRSRQRAIGDDARGRRRTPCRSGGRPITRTRARAQLDTISVEPTSPDPSLQSTTTLTYDDYGSADRVDHRRSPASPRARGTSPTRTAWPGAPEEHLFASAAWVEHDQSAMRQRLPAGGVAADAAGLRFTDRDDGRKRRRDGAHLRRARATGRHADRWRAPDRRDVCGPPGRVRRHERSSGHRDERLAAGVQDVRCARCGVAHELRRLRRAARQHVRDL